MKGFWLSFIVPLGRAKGAIGIVDWLRGEALRLGVQGLTVTMAESGYGRDHTLRSARFLETGDQPAIVSMAVTPELAEALFSSIKHAELEIFYTKTPIEYGIVGAAPQETAPHSLT